ncbi:hypothetical protein SOVF_118630 [Spinacia oleracea]|uniref:DNA polymerase II subunit B4 n=1 Tax=Spinacia oleracea TaxID=3562 RepID=A0A9R0K354_SPIOL|nr:DNA polymerase II subunit B4 [Spinacia oleracea]KNA13236.1 hypothetical protein SOVF_118630 [Spinacia oleracea]
MGKEKATAVATEAEELPKTIVRRVVKEKLSQISTDGGDVTLHKEALIAFSESARIFIHYLSATAHDICNDSNRQIINAEDVLNALEEVEFSEFVEPLRAALDEFKKKAAGKRAGSAKAKEASKKRKTDEETATKNVKAEVTATENGEEEDTATENGKDEETATENGEEEDTATENGKDEETATENGEEEDTGTENGEEEETATENGEEEETATENGEEEDTATENGKEEENEDEEDEEEEESENNDDNDDDDDSPDS